MACLIVILMVPFIGRASDENIPSVEFDNGDTNTNLILLEPGGKKVEVDNFFQLVNKFVPSKAELEAVVAYLVDLKQDEKYEIISVARFKGQKNKLLVLDLSGKLLASKDIEAGEALYFGPQKKGFPVFFGYKTSWALSAGGADWSFDFWNGVEIKNAAGADQRIGKEEGMEPYIKYVPEKGTMEIVSDDGEMLWDKKGMEFIEPWQPVSEIESLEGCSEPDKSLSHLALGKQYFHKREYKCAIQEYRLEVEDHPDDYSTWQYLGYAYMKNGETANAVNTLECSVRIKPDYVMGHYNLALAYFANLDDANAVSQIQKVIELNPTYEEIMKKDNQFREILKSKAYLDWKNQQPNAIEQKNANHVPVTYKNYDEYLKNGEINLTRTNAFEPVVYVEQMRLFGVSPFVENESAFLNLTPSQRDDFVAFIKKMAEISFQLRSNSPTVDYYKNNGELEEYEKNLKVLRKEWDQIPQSLLKIFGQAKYRRFLDYILFEKSCSLCEPDDETELKKTYFYSKLLDRLKIGFKNSNLTEIQLENVKDSMAKDYFTFYKITYDLKKGTTYKLMEFATTHQNQEQLIKNASSNEVSIYRSGFEEINNNISSLIKDSEDKKTFWEEFGIDLK